MVGRRGLHSNRSVLPPAHAGAGPARIRARDSESATAGPAVREPAETHGSGPSGPVPCGSLPARVRRADSRLTNHAAGTGRFKSNRARPPGRARRPSEPAQPSPGQAFRTSYYDRAEQSPRRRRPGRPRRPSCTGSRARARASGWLRHGLRVNAPLSGNRGPGSPGCVHRARASSSVRVATPPSHVEEDAALGLGRAPQGVEEAPCLTRTRRAS
jgi:hypothetical protein